jgi:transposase/predicted nucleic acid-binding Zn finger protein
MSEREQKALVIAAKSKVAKKGDVWLVPSQSNNGHYIVASDLKHCTCPDYELRQRDCKHILATEIVIERERRVTETSDGQTKTTTIRESVKVTYKQEWTAYNTAQTNEKALFQKLLYDLCNGVVEPTQTKGRPRLAYRDMIFSAAFKIFSTMSARRFMCDLSDAQAKGYITKVPHFNSIFNYLELEALTPVLHELITRSALPLKALETNFAVDSSGFSTCQYVTWYNTKYGREDDKHDWLKIHLMTGVKTNVVTSVEVSDRSPNDSLFLPQLVDDTAKNFTINQVSADKGYTGLKNHHAIAKHGATPYIAFKSNASGKAGGMFETMFHYYSLNREDFLTQYHRRSNVETTFHMIKAKFGSRIRSKGPTAQVNEALCKVLCHNIVCVIQSIFEFGIEASFCAEGSVAQIPHRF